MIRLNYIRSTKISPSLKQIVIFGEHISIDGDRYEKLAKKPYGKSIVRKLIKEDRSKKITCYA